MRLPQTGGCQCGKGRYAITEEPQSVYTCHCTVNLAGLAAVAPTDRDG